MTDKVAKEIRLNLDQWEQVKNALDYYENAAREFMTLREAEKFRQEFILPVYDQMPDEVF